MKTTEDKLANINLVDPTESYLQRGQEILNRNQSPEPGFGWRLYFSSAFTISAVLLVTFGFTDGLTGVGFGLSDRTSDILESSQGTSQILEHQFLDSINGQAIEADTDTSANDAVQPYTVNGLFVANCQECHDLQILNALRPDNFEGTPDELDELLIRSITELLN